MRNAPVATAVAVLACLVATSAFAEPTLILHGVSALAPIDCNIADPCPPEPGPPGATVNLPPGPVQLYLMVRNQEPDLAGVQTALQIPASWPVFASNWDCLPGQLNAVTPGPPWGPDDGSLTSAFNCIQGSDTVVIGGILFSNADAGCAEQVPSIFPFENHVLTCGGTPVQVNALNEGRVCIDEEGYDACFAAVPVENTTWGSIKAQYN